VTAGDLAVVLAAVLCSIGFAALIVVLWRVLDTMRSLRTEVIGCDKRPIRCWPSSVRRPPTPGQRWPKRAMICNASTVCWDPPKQSAAR
jgi:hypothetical protein